MRCNFNFIINYKKVGPDRAKCHRAGPAAVAPGGEQMKGPVEESWKSSYRMEIWMTGSTAHSLLFLPDHDLLVVGESDGTVRVLDEQSLGPTRVA